MNTSRRAVLGASLAAPALALLSPARAGATMGGGAGDTVHAGPIPDGFSLFATAPDAAASPTNISRSIQALAVHGDDLFYGYGDYSANSGSMTGKGTNLSAISLTTKAQRVVIPQVRTEAILSLRQVGSFIVAPVIDQTDGNQILALTNGHHCEILVGPEMEHTFDVCAVGPYLIAVGSGSYNDAPGAIAYEYNWVTRKWNATPIFSKLTSGAQAADNWTRYYWTRSIGPYVFVQDSDSWGTTGYMLRYNVFTKKVDRVKPASVVPSSEMAVVTYRGHIVMCDGNSVAAINAEGKEVVTTSLPEYVFCFDFVEYHGVLYMATSEGIYRSTDIKHWTKVMDAFIEFSSSGDEGWFSMAIHRGHVYLGGNNGRIIRSNATI